MNGDTGDDETSSLFGEASKFHKPGEYTVDQDTGHIIWFVISFNVICFLSQDTLAFYIYVVVAKIMLPFELLKLLVFLLTDNITSKSR